MDQPSAARLAHPRRGRSRPCRTGLIITVLAGLAVLLTACGGSGGSDPAPSGSASPASSQSAAVAFAQCMRSHGVTDFPDPQNGRFVISNPNLGSEPQFKPAQTACQHLLGGGGTSSGSNNSQMLAFSHCMQTHGVPNFPDPQAGGIITGGHGIDPNSPQFQQALQQCQSLLPGSAQGQQPVGQGQQP